MINSLQHLKDKHKGSRFIICGSGGSLLDIDVDKLNKDIIIICCNSSTYHFNKFNYAVFTDETANFSNWYLNLNNKECEVINCNSGINKIKDNTIYLEKDFSNWKFEDSNTKVIGGYDVIHCATHIAWMMGASEIILAGVDLKHINSNKKHAYDQSLIDTAPQSLLDILNPTFKANEDLFDGQLGISLGGWIEINKHNPNLNVKTISKNTNLNIYPFLDVKYLYD